MAVSCGFYNSLSGDRKYDAVQFSEIFDGIINDGVYESIGDWFVVKATTGMNITVGTGRAWFNHTWTKNDALLPLTVETSEAILNRIDTVVLEVNSEDDVRDNSIRIVKGAPSNTPVPPTLIRSGRINQYPLADIYVAADVSGITQANITNRVGTSYTPFVTGIIDVMDIDDLVAQWMAQWEQFVDKNSAEYIAWKNSSESDFTTWSTNQKAAFVEWMTETKSEFNNWMTQSKGDFDDWFDNIKYVLDGDVAGHLQNEIESNADAISANATLSKSSDTALYQFRRCTHNAVYDKLVGISYVKNQLLQNGNFASTSGWVAYTSALSVSNNVANVVVSSSAQDGSIYRSIQGIGGHKYLVMADIRSDGTNTASLRADLFGNNFKLDTTSSSFSTLSNVISLSSANTFRVLASGYAPSMTFQVKNFMCIDLTLMFGTAIADKIYTMEQATAGSGLAWIRQYGFLNDAYIEYNAGAIESSAPTVRKVVGKNQLEILTSTKVKNGINILVTNDKITFNGTCSGWLFENLNYEPNDLLKFRAGEYKITGGCAGVSIIVYADGNVVYRGTAQTEGSFTIPSGTERSYARIEISSGQVLSNASAKYMIRYASNTDDTYEPYKEVTYPLGGDILRGVPQLVGDDLVADGDIKTSDGVIAGRYLFINLGDYSWDRINNQTRFNCTSGIVSSIKPQADVYTKANILCSKYVTDAFTNVYDNVTDKTIAITASGAISIYDTAYTDAAAFKASLDGVYLVVEAKTPTSSVSTPFTSPQVSLETEETDTICGHDSVVVDIPEWMQNEYFDDVRANASKVQGMEKNISDLQTALGGKKIVVCPEAQRGSDPNTLYFCY